MAGPAAALIKAHDARRPRFGTSLADLLVPPKAAPPIASPLGLRTGRVEMNATTSHPHLPARRYCLHRRDMAFGKIRELSHV